MWKLPNGRTISKPRGVLIDDINHPANIFFRWSLAELNAIGINPFIEEKYNNKYYTSTGYTDTNEGGIITRRHTVENKYSGVELKVEFADGAKRQLKGLWKKATDELDYLNTFDPDNQTDIDIWQTYKLDLKAAFITAKIELQSITDYEAGIEFIETGFNALLPIMPFEDNELI